MLLKILPLYYDMKTIVTLLPIYITEVLHRHTSVYIKYVSTHFYVLLTLGTSYYMYYTTYLRISL